MDNLYFVMSIVSTLCSLVLFILVSLLLAKILQKKISKPLFAKIIASIIAFFVARTVEVIFVVLYYIVIGASSYLSISNLIFTISNVPAIGLIYNLIISIKNVVPSLVGEGSVLSIISQYGSVLSSDALMLYLMPLIVGLVQLVCNLGRIIYLVIFFISKAKNNEEVQQELEVVEQAEALEHQPKETTIETVQIVIEQAKDDNKVEENKEQLINIIKEEPHENLNDNLIIEPDIQTEKQIDNDQPKIIIQPADVTLQPTKELESQMHNDIVIQPVEKQDQIVEQINNDQPKIVIQPTPSILQSTNIQQPTVEPTETVSQPVADNDVYQPTIMPAQPVVQDDFVAVEQINKVETVSEVTTQSEEEKQVTMEDALVVAEKLIKFKELRDSQIIDEQEFIEVKKKLLSRI